MVPLGTRVEGPYIPFPGDPPPKKIDPPHKWTLRGSGRVPVGSFKGGVALLVFHIKERNIVRVKHAYGQG